MLWRAAKRDVIAMALYRVGSESPAPAPSLPSGNRNFPIGRDRIKERRRVDVGSRSDRRVLKTGVGCALIVGRSASYLRRTGGNG